MSGNYEIAPSQVPGRWMVIDCSTGDVVRVGERPMRNLARRDADDLAELLNHLERLRRSRLH